MFGPTWPRRIDLYKRIGLEGNPKEYLLEIEERLMEGLRAKLGLHPCQEGQCHGGIVHASKIGALTETLRKIYIILC